MPNSGCPDRAPHDRLSASAYIVSCAFAAPRDVRLRSLHFRVRAFPVSRNRVAERPATGATRADRPLAGAARPASLAARQPAAARATAPPRPSAERARHAALSAALAADARPAAAMEPLALRRPHRRCASRPRGPVGVDVEALGALQASDFTLYLNAAERAWAGRSRAPLLLGLDAQGSGRQGGRHGRAAEPARGRHHARAATARPSPGGSGGPRRSLSAPATSAMSPPPSSTPP